MMWELTRLVAVRLLDTTGRRGGLASGLGGELLTGSLATSGLTCRWVLVVCWKVVRYDEVIGKGRQCVQREGGGGS